MTDPRWPYHAVSNLDALGEEPSKSKLPADEDDFASHQEAKSWLDTRGGGIIERHNVTGYEVVETVAPSTANAA